MPVSLKISQTARVWNSVSSNNPFSNHIVRIAEKQVVLGSRQPHDAYAAESVLHILPAINVRSGRGIEFQGCGPLQLILEQGLLAPFDFRQFIGIPFCVAEKINLDV